MRNILGRQVEGDESGLIYLDEIDEQAEDLFRQAKYKHRAKFKDKNGRSYILTRESPGKYLVAERGHHTGWM